MHKLVPLIEKVILNSFPDVMEVDFEKVKVYLGSSFELPEEERTIERIEIIVTIDNLKKGYTWYQLSNLKIDDNKEKIGQFLLKNSLKKS